MSINLDSKDIVRDPRPTYEKIRAVGSVVRNEVLGGAWMVVGYEEMMEALHSPERFSNHAYGLGGELDIMAGAKYMINEDPPEQTRLRNVARDAFMRRSLLKFEATVDQVVNQVLDGPELSDWTEGQDLEAMAAYARMVPATVIALLLGVPTDDIPKFVKWSDALSAVMDSGQHGDEGWENVVAAAAEAGASLKEYLAQQVEAHKADKRDDLINDLLEANINGDLQPDEMLATLILLLIAGNETTTKLIGIALRMIGESPDLRKRLIAEPELMPSAVDEFLRFEGVSALLPRIATQDTTLGGVEIKAGEILLLMNGAANRDPKGFDNPNEFVVDRKSNQHVAFGHGVHFCLGNSLARMEARLAISGFLSRFPDYTVKDYTYAPIFLARGLQTMTLTLG